MRPSKRLGDDAINLAITWGTLKTLSSGSSFSISGEDSPAKPGDTLAFFEEALAFLGSAIVKSSTADDPRQLQLQNPVGWLRPGLKALNLNRIPSGFYMSGVTVRNKIGRGILIGGFHGLIQNSTFQSVTMSGILFHFSSFWS